MVAILLWAIAFLFPSLTVDRNFRLFMSNYGQVAFDGLRDGFHDLSNILGPRNIYRNLGGAAQVIRRGVIQDFGKLRNFRLDAALAAVRDLVNALQTFVHRRLPDRVHLLFALQPSQETSSFLPESAPLPDGNRNWPSNFDESFTLFLFIFLPAMIITYNALRRLPIGLPTDVTIAVPVFVGFLSATRLADMILPWLSVLQLFVLDWLQSGEGQVVVGLLVGIVLWRSLPSIWRAVLRGVHLVRRCAKMFYSHLVCYQILGLLILTGLCYYPTSQVWSAYYFFASFLWLGACLFAPVLRLLPGLVAFLRRTANAEPHEQPVDAPAQDVEVVDHAQQAHEELYFNRPAFNAPPQVAHRGPDPAALPLVLYPAPPNPIPQPSSPVAQAGTQALQGGGDQSAAGPSCSASTPSDPGVSFFSAHSDSSDEESSPESSPELADDESVGGDAATISDGLLPALEVEEAPAVEEADDDDKFSECMKS
ncbi:hypothetical protein C8R44DRAFT_848985 [Mycena epipterygia]|nr:hypothetical protein C8R44DRAFT_848985 [Mycena epipterygia]